MSFTILSVIILLLGALTVFRQVRIGYKIGLIRSVARMALFMFCAVIAAFLSDLFSFVFEDVITNRLYNISAIRSLDAQFGNIYYPVSKISEAFAALAMYIPVFFILFWILSLAFKIVLKKLAPKTDSADYSCTDAPYHERDGKRLGAAVGAVSGLLVTLVVLTPVCGSFKAGESLVDSIEKFSGTSTVEKDEDDDFYRYADDFMLSVAYSSGGRTLFDLTTTVRGSEKSASIREEIEYLGKLDSDDVTELVTQLGRADTKAFSELLDRSRESVLFEAMAYAAVTGASSAWNRGDTYMGVGNPFASYGEAYDNFTDEILWACASSTPKSFSANMTTLMNLIGIINNAEDEFGGAYREEIDALVSGDIVTGIRRELEKNPNMSGALNALDRIVISVLTEEMMNSDKYSEYNRDVLFSDIASAINFTDFLSGEDRIVRVAEYLDAAFDTFDMYLPEGVTEELSERLLTEIFAYGSVTETDVMNFFNRYLNGNVFQPTYEFESTYIERG